MNEVFLILIILFTFLSFIAFNKKIGTVGVNPLPATIIEENNDGEAPLTRIIYSQKDAGCQQAYSNLWHITATSKVANIGHREQHKEIVLIYHQPAPSDKWITYKKRDLSIFDPERRNTDDSNCYSQDVCVISSISDIQYRHVLMSWESI